MPHPGEVLGDRYRLDDRIAAGGMGEVWQATDTVLGRDVAVKTLHAGRAGDPGFQTRFRHEARAMAVLHHPGVADVYDYGQSGPDAYIVMARVHGEALNQRIAERGRLTAAETMSIVAQAGRALDAAHRAGIVHRDVKPGNLIIRPDGTVVLVDFGVARSAESAELTGAKEVVGTALYIAPEQVSKETTGPPADIYALGTVAYHCLAGHPPFLGESPIAVALQHVSDEPPALPDDVPPPVRALVATAMAKDPADRFSSAEVMAEAAERALNGGGDTTAILAAAPAARPATPGTDTAIMPVPLAASPPAGDHGGRKRPFLLAALAAVLILGTAGAVLALNPDLFGGPPPAGSVTNSPGPAVSAKVTPTKGTKRQNGNNTVPAGGQPSTTPTRSATPAEDETTTPPAGEPTDDETTTSTPEVTATTGAPATTAASGEQDNSGSGSDGDEDNSGSGGGEEEAAEVAVTPAG
jgi:serine/threonine-protein kinase